jgi:hypothetical protein
MAVRSNIINNHQIFTLNKSEGAIIKNVPSLFNFNFIIPKFYPIFFGFD